MILTDLFPPEEVSWANEALLYEDFVREINLLIATNMTVQRPLFIKLL